MGLLVALGSGCATTDSGPHTSTVAMQPGANATVTPRTDMAYSKFADVVYTPAGWPKELKADIYRPNEAGPWPGVVLLYGGSWSSADHRWQMTLLARKIARRGYVVVVPAYRGTPEDRYPAPFEDVREAVRWMRVHAAAQKIIPDKIAAYGFSAGGQLAGLLATRDGPAEVRVQALVAASAPTDLLIRPTGEILPRYLGTTPELNEALYREASPVYQVTPDDPPTFLYHGTGDNTVWPKHSENFKAALDHAGVRAELRLIPKRGHAMNLIVAGKEEDAAIDFLDSVLKAK